MTGDANHQRICYHEAGHAVAYSALGIGVASVHANRLDGYTDPRRKPSDALRNDAAELRRWTIAIAAGDRAQHMWRRDVLPATGDCKDGPMVNSNVERLSELSPGPDWRAVLERETDELLANDWRRVEALAAELLKHEHIDGDQAEQIIRTACP